MNSPNPKLSKLEEIKQDSTHLRASLVEELQTDATSFAEAEKQVLKFHGIYQQDNRDVRRKQDKEYSFMLRCRFPAGKITADQYLFCDEIADRYANGTLRITTRQVFQFHGILKSNLKPTLQELNQRLMTCYAACGDVVRNVLLSPDPRKDPLHEQVEQVVFDISDHFLP
ncbi:MAG: NADPH-dependent assimilatory sulfite reductase hemoprotein subunit, partial [Myxococcota bacterium]